MTNEISIGLKYILLIHFVLGSIIGGVFLFLGPGYADTAFEALRDAGATVVELGERE